MADTNFNTREKLRNVDWKSLTLRLLMYTKLKYDKVFRSLQFAHEPQDLVQGAIVAVLSETRRLPEHIDPFVGLCRIIDSMASHLIQRAYSINGGERKLRRVEAEIYDFPGGQGVSYNIQEAVPLRQAELENIINLFRYDVVLTDILELRAQDPALVARDISAILGIPVAEIYKANRRLKRSIRRLKEKIEKEKS